MTSKYRPKVFSAEMLQPLGEIVADLSQKWDCQLIEFNGEGENIHLLFQYFPQMELTKFINNLKTVTSKRLRNEFQEQINKHV
ncbi:MAG: IS200/IS605 family transposase [Moorea sp. SIO1F2]|nr:IS200/IS605 family transposase [Moorena sp. SIO4G2]NET82699.1 IS200/IS605 family transposase [Moorena sp. SIO1F2]